MSQDFKSTFKIEGYLPPVTWVARRNGKKYASSGCIHKEIPLTMTHNDVLDCWVNLGKPVDIEKYRKDEPKYELFSKVVQSNRGKGEYIVSFINGLWSCTCSGYNYRKKCVHLESVKNELKEKLQKV